MLVKGCAGQDRLGLLVWSQRSWKQRRRVDGTQHGSAIWERPQIQALERGSSLFFSPLRDMTGGVELSGAGRVPARCWHGHPRREKIGTDRAVQVSGGDYCLIPPPAAGALRSVQAGGDERHGRQLLHKPDLSPARDRCGTD